MIEKKYTILLHSTTIQFVCLWLPIIDWMAKSTHLILTDQQSIEESIELIENLTSQLFGRWYDKTLFIDIVLNIYEGMYSRNIYILCLKTQTQTWLWFYYNLSQDIYYGILSPSSFCICSAVILNFLPWVVPPVW